MNDIARSLVADPSPSEVLAEFTAGLDLAEMTVPRGLRPLCGGPDGSGVEP